MSSADRLVSTLIAWFTLLLLPGIYFFSELSAVLSLEILAAVCAVTYGLLLFRRSLAIGADYRSIVFLLLTWLFLAARSTLVSVDASTSWPVFVKLAAMALITLPVALSIDRSEKNTVYFQAAAWTGILHGVIAIQEYIEAPPIPATWLDPAARHIFRTRCAGVLTDPNVFAAFLSVIFLLTLGLLLFGRGKSEQLLAGTSLILSGTAIFTTLSRGGWIGMLAGLAALLVFYLAQDFRIDGTGKIILAVSAVILLTVFISGPFKMRLLSIAKPSDMTFAQRTLINKGIFASINRFPVAGHGLHTFNQIYPRYRIVGGDYPMNAHNEFIHSMLETGFLSAMLLAAICLYVLKIAWAAVKRGNLPAGIFAAAFFSLLVQNLSGFSSRILPTSVLIALTVGGTLAFSVQNGHCRPINYHLRRILALLMIISGIAVFWQSLGIYEAQHNMQMASEFLHSGQPSQALTILEKVQAKDPGNSIALSMQGSAFLQAGNRQGARHAWLMATTLNRHEAIFHVNLARLSIKENTKNAEESYKNALSLDPASELYRLEFARFLLTLNRRTEAMEQLNLALSYSPGFHQVYTSYLEIEKLKKELELTAD